METIHAAIEFSKSSILTSNSDGPWTPEEKLQPSCPEEYSFPDLIAFSSDH
jgi:hypothetical protein